MQFWLDEHVATANPDLKQLLHAFSRRHAGRFLSCGAPQLVPGGESIKNDVHILERMLKVMNDADLDRRSYVVVVGGGGDWVTVRVWAAVAAAAA